MTLIILGIILLAIGSSVFSKSEQLKRFNKSLFNQINDLEAEVDAAHPQFNGNPFGRFYSPHRTVSEVQMEKHIKLMKRQTKSRRSNIEYIRTLFGLKEYIDQFNI